MIIVERKTSELIEAEYNPRTLTAEQFEHIKSSLQRFGFVDPIIVNKHETRTDIIVGGHQRMKVARELGIDPVPTVEVNLTLEQERELNVRLNKNTGSFDWDILANEFEVEDLVDWGFTEDELTGFDVEEVDAPAMPDGDKEPFQQMTFTLHDEQAEVVRDAMAKAKEQGGGDSPINDNSNGNAIFWACQGFVRG